MTVPFLKKVVEDLTAKLHDLSNVVIVVPGKRAGLFFNQYLEQVCQLPVWTPAFKTLDEVFDQLTELSVPDTPLLIYHLYEAYQQTVALQAGETPVVSEPLDHFYAWGEVMLSDFDDIDNNLSHADDIFRNLQDLDELTDMDYLSEDQLKAIERYFGYFDKDKDSRLKEKFLSVWNLLCPTYHRFRERLLKRKLAYPGMLKRMVVEKGVDTELLKAEKYVFVGFNVLNATERTLLDRLKQEQKAMFYWDYDRAYMKDGNLASAYAEAGRFVMDNVGHFGSELNADDICYDNMHNSKKITFVASPSDNAQARFAGEWLHENVSADSQLNQTAVVLCDEKLLQPMLHSLPTDSNGRDYQMNVTMGFPLIETPASSFVLALMQLQTFGGRGNWWNYTQVANVLKHPYAVRMAGEKAVGKLADIKKNNMFFIDPAFFDDDEFLKLLFTRQDNIDQLLGYLAKVVRIIAQTYVEEDEADFDNQLYEESLFNVYTIINRLADIHREVLQEEDFTFVRMADMSNERFLRLLRQILQTASVPFHGEPAEGIQIIGMLETRCLDFKNLVMIGMNDENLPKNVKLASFIPYTLREAHGMTTMERRACLFAYGFYRLIQRAENITLVFNKSDDEMSRGEMSRYMTQMLIEKEHLFSPSTSISQIALEAKVATGSIPVFTVRKTGEVIKKLRERFKDNFFSPTAINTYINCPFLFYLQKVAGLKPDEDLTEEVGNDIFGNIFHHCMEHFYKEHLHEVLTKDFLEKAANNDPFIIRLVDDAFREEFFKLPKGAALHYNGEQMLNRDVIVKYVKKQLKFDARLCPLRVEAVENQQHEMMVQVNGTHLKLGGVIDRIDTIFVGNPQKEQHRIVDYKTSAQAQRFPSLDALFDSSINNRPYHILQTLYYSDIYTETCDRPVAPALMYVKPVSVDDNTIAEQDYVITKVEGIGRNQKRTMVTDFAAEYKEEFHKRMMGLITEIFSPEVDFRQTENPHACQWCDFKQMCGR